MAQPEQGGAMLAGPEVAKLFTFQFWELQLLSEVPQSLDGEIPPARFWHSVKSPFPSGCVTIPGLY